MPEDYESIIRNFLRDTVSANKRRCAIRQRKREPDTSECDHSNWNIARYWCDDCGITKKELIEGM